MQLGLNSLEISIVTELVCSLYARFKGKLFTNSKIMTIYQAVPVYAKCSI